MPKRYRIAVCKGPNCRREGSDQLDQQLQQEAKARQLGEICEVTRGGCYGLCHLAPNVILREMRHRVISPFSTEDFQLMGWKGEIHFPEVESSDVIKIMGYVVSDSVS